MTRTTYETLGDLTGVAQAQLALGRVYWHRGEYAVALGVLETANIKLEP